MEFIISQETAEKVLNYLAQRPWEEVDNIIHPLLALKPVETPEPTLPPETDVAI